MKLKDFAKSVNEYAELYPEATVIEELEGDFFPVLCPFLIGHWDDGDDFITVDRFQDEFGTTEVEINAACIN